MLMLEIMEKYKWDYHTYMIQPTWLIDMIVQKMEIDTKKEIARSKQKH